MSDPSKNFGEAAKRYSAFRPDYPAAVFEFLTAHAASGRGFAVDLGAGSGQATRRLATLYDRVVAVEPDSRLAGDGAFAANVAVEVKAAEEADFPAGSVDAVISATAFHWMDQPLVCRHVARWLKPGGAFFPFAFDAFEVEGEAGEIYKSEFKKWAAYRDRRLIDCYDYLRALQQSGAFNTVVPFSHRARYDISPATAAGLASTFSFARAYAQAKENGGYFQSLHEKLARFGDKVTLIAPIIGAAGLNA